MQPRAFVLVVVLAACGGGSRAPAPASPAAPAAAPAASDDATASTHQVEYVAVRGSAGIEGVVRERAGGEPLAGATLVLQGQGLAGPEARISDDAGRFVFAHAVPGRYTVSAYYLDLQYDADVEMIAHKRAVVTIDLGAPVPDSGDTEPERAPPPAFTDAMDALRAGVVAQAYALAQRDLARRDDARTRGIAAIAGWAAASERLAASVLGPPGGGTAPLRAALVAFVAELDPVRDHLVAAARDPAFALELCVACMAGPDGYLAVPPGLLDVERDRAGKVLPPGDPRRRPVYRFDHGDLLWGRAMVSFQQALAHLALAYDWSWLDRYDGVREGNVTIRLVEPDRVARARALIVEALDASDGCRKAYLAETDDDREWVPNPRQQSHASPLPVDAQLYETWADVIADLRLLVAGRTGLPLRDLVAAVSPSNAAEVPGGFIDLGAMLATPKDIVLRAHPINALEIERDLARRQALISHLLRGVLGNGYRAAKMKPSRLIDRLTRIRAEVDKLGPQALEDKLKYLLWLN